jgi:hypothetical protein
VLFPDQRLWYSPFLWPWPPWLWQVLTNNGEWGNGSTLGTGIWSMIKHKACCVCIRIKVLWNLIGRDTRKFDLGRELSDYGKTIEHLKLFLFSMDLKDPLVDGCSLWPTFIENNQDLGNAAYFSMLLMFKGKYNTS